MVCERCGCCCGDNHFWSRTLLKGFKERPELKEYVLSIFPQVREEVDFALENIESYDYWGIVPEPARPVKSKLLELMPDSDIHDFGKHCVFLTFKDGLANCLIHPSVIEEKLGFSYDLRGGECRVGGCFKGRSP